MRLELNLTTHALQKLTTHANTETTCFQGTQNSDEPGCGSMLCDVKSDGTSQIDEVVVLICLCYFYSRPPYESTLLTTDRLTTCVHSPTSLSGMLVAIYCIRGIVLHLSSLCEDGCGVVFLACWNYSWSLTFTYRRLNVTQPSKQATTQLTSRRHSCVCSCQMCLRHLWLSISWYRLSL